MGIWSLANTDVTELLLIALGAAGLSFAFYKENRTVTKFRRYSTLAETSGGTIYRAVTLALKVKVLSKFVHIDEPSLKDYQRFRKAINLLLAMTAANLMLIGIMIAGIALVAMQNGVESYIRPLDATLVVVFFATNLFAFFVSDKIEDNVTIDKPSPVSLEGMHERPAYIMDGPCILHLQGPSMAKLSPHQQALVDAARRSAERPTVYPALTEAEKKVLQNDPTTAKHNLIAAGLLNEDGMLPDHLRRS